MKHFFVVLFSLSTLLLSAQDSIIIHKDVRLDLLIKKQQQINEQTSHENKKYKKGFRLLILTTNKREEAVLAKSKLYAHFHDLKTYLIYQAPNFKLKVGNFSTQKEAEEFQLKLTAIFPNGVFIIPDIIEFTVGKESNPTDF